MFYRNLFVVVLIVLGGCRAAGPGESYVVFEDKETGWSTRYPALWEVVPDAEAAATEARGQKKLETTVDRKIDMDHSRLLWIRKGQVNMFTSNKMIYKFKTAEAYNANMVKIFEIMRSTQQRLGMKMEYKEGSMIIDGLEFQTMDVTVFREGTDKVAGHQLVCSRYINGKYGLVLNLNYTNDKTREALMGVLVASKFAIRD